MALVTFPERKVTRRAGAEPRYYFFSSCAERTQLSFRGSATHKYTRAQAAQMKSRPKGGFVIQTLDSRFRRNGMNN